MVLAPTVTTAPTLLAEIATERGIANEVLDVVPFSLVQRRGDGIFERGVILTEAGFAWEEMPLRDGDLRRRAFPPRTPRSGAFVFGRPVGAFSGGIAFRQVPHPSTTLRRNSRMLRPASVSSMALAAALACVPAHAGRTYVSSTGIDQSNGITNGQRMKGACSTRPCRTFQAAHDAVMAGGEVVALDSADYGPVVINKSVTITGNPGIVASISAVIGDGVTIATPGIHVVLRNLNIKGAAPFAGIDGIAMTAGDSLTIENCVVSNFMASGVAVNAAADVRIVDSVMRGNLDGASISGNAAAEIVHSRFLGNSSSGLVVRSAGGTTSASVSDSVASGNGLGFVAVPTSGTARMSLIRSTASDNFIGGFVNQVSGTAGGAFAQMTISGGMASSNGAGFSNSSATGSTAVMTVGSSTASGNRTGFSNGDSTGGTKRFRSLGDNLVRHNRTDSFGTITRLSGPQPPLFP